MLSNNTSFELLATEVEVMASDIPGWTLASEGRLTVALDVTITEELLQEGISREVVNRIQHIRKEQSFDLQDKIIVRCTGAPKIISAINAFKGYICAEILAVDILTNLSPEQAAFDLEVEGEMLQLDITKV
jgi:isoleucyl-tRNA synthetase